MTIYAERTARTLLTGAADADGDPITLRRINGAIVTSWPHVLTLPTGRVTISETGVVAYDDQGSVAGHPTDGVTASNGSFTYTLWDGKDESPAYVASVDLAGTDTTAPGLSGPTAAGTGATTYAGAVTTDKAGGTLHWVVTASPTTPSAVQIEAGLTQNGAAAPDQGSRTVTAAGPQSVSGGGLATAQGWYLHFAHRDGGGNLSSGVTSASFATGTGSGTLTVTAGFPDRMVIDCAMAAGRGHALVPVSGSADPGAGIEGYDPVSGTWSVIGTADGSGQWSALITVPPTDGLPAQGARVRLAANHGVERTTPETFHAGTVIMLLGQSEIQHGFQAATDNEMGISVQDDDALQILLVDNDTVENSGLTHHFVTAQNEVTEGLAALSNLFAANAPGHTFLCLDAAHSGTGRRPLASNGNTKRSWANFQNVVDWVRSRGSEVGLISEIWFSSDANVQQNWNTHFAPFYWRQTWASAAFPLGTTAGASSTAYVCDRCLFDMNVAANQTGQGVFRRDRTRIVQGTGLRRVERGKTGGQSYNRVAAETLEDPGATTDYTQRNFRRIRAQQWDWFNDPRAGETFAQGIAAMAFKHGEWNGSNWGDMIHPSDDHPDGVPLFQQYMGAQALRAMGVVPYTEPVFQFVGMGAGGAYMDLQVAGTGTLTTARIEDNENQPSGASHYTQIMGFEISGSPNGFSAVIQDAGNRIVRITKAGGFVTGNKVRFGWGSCGGQLFEQQGNTDAIYKDYPLIKGVFQGFRGIPVTPFPFSPEITVP